jgi:hypothetical protein
MNERYRKALLSLEKGDVTPALIAAVSEVVEAWGENPERLRGLSVRDTISLINALTQAQKHVAKGEAGGDTEDVFKARLQLVKESD